MTKKKIVIIDPHADDFVYKPMAYKIARRRPLQKYGYLANYFRDSYYVTFKSSSVPAKLIEAIPSWILRVINRIELMFWRKLNDISERPVARSVLLKRTVFIFGYKKINRVLGHLLDIGYSGNVIVHLSHYHTFEIDKIYYNLFDITLAFDMDVSRCDFFKQRFPNYTKEILVVPFQLNDRFSKIDTVADKQLRLLATGTYHKDPNNVFGACIDGFYTLHPHRLQFASLKNLPSFVVNRLSLYKSSGFINPFSYRQKKYFEFDILKEYLCSSHAFVGGEITGCIGIGTIEAMACGCIVFITKHEHDYFLLMGLQIDCVVFDDIEDLNKKICSLETKLYRASVNNIAISKKFESTVLAEDFINETVGFL